MGTTVHDALASIAIQTQAGLLIDIDEIATAAAGQMRLNLLTEDAGPDDLEFAEEQAALVEGLVRAFYSYAWPMLLAEYPEVLHVEHEMEYPHDREGHYAPSDPFAIFMAKPDLILGSPDGRAIYVEYKTTSTKKDKWINSWDTAVQLHSTTRAIQTTTGIEIDGVIVQGLYKGYESYGKQSSPFCYAYKRSGNPPFTEDQISYDYRAGFRRSPTWELRGGVKEWVAQMPPEVLADQFPRTPLITLNEDLVQKFFAQRALRESEIEAAIVINDSEMLDRVFPQRFDQCRPGFGYACPYEQLCHGDSSDPLALNFVYRESHHKREAEQDEQHE